MSYDERMTAAEVALGDAPFGISREQYEAACLAAGIDAAHDHELGTYADKHASPYPGEWPEEAHVALNLRRRRMRGIEDEAPPKPKPQLRMDPVGRPRPARCHTGGDCSSLCSPDTCPCGDGHGWFHCS